ncbi:MAG: molybdenum cofactor biosynthesis protein MoaE [Gemmatimonadales bacterium]
MTRSPIDVAALAGWVGDPGRGGAVTFVGTVRASEADGSVAQIEYSGYEQMIEEEFSRILGEAESKWPGGSFVGQHRLGPVPLGEASIAIAVATPHRAEAFDACRYIIEQVKARLPVWKKERFADGSESWRDNGSVDRSD